MARWFGEVDPFLGESSRMRHLASLALRANAAQDPILIVGETGAGKGVLARWLHRHGPRAAGSFVDVDCATDPVLLEGELYGHACNGSAEAVGLLERARGGTLFLDEVGALGASLEARILATIKGEQAGEEPARTDVGWILSSNRSLAFLADHFDTDLWGSVRPLEIPPLRDRREDIPYLAHSLLRQLASDGVSPPGVSPAALSVLQRHPWPGNVRELKMVLERALIFGDPREIRPEDLHFDRLA